MKTGNSRKGNVKYGARIIAVFLVLGGLLGILNLVMMHLHLAHLHQSLPVISSVVSVALFAWGILTGIVLWRATPRGFKWAMDFASGVRRQLLANVRFACESTDMCAAGQQVRP